MATDHLENMQNAALWSNSRFRGWPCCGYFVAASFSASHICTGWMRGNFSTHIGERSHWPSGANVAFSDTKLAHDMTVAIWFEDLCVRFIRTQPCRGELQPSGAGFLIASCAQGYLGVQADHPPLKT